MPTAANPLYRPTATTSPTTLTPDLVADDTNGATDVFTWNAAMGTTIRLTRGNGESFESTISADGTLIAFMSQASDLVDDTDANGWFDVYVWDRTG